MVLPGWRRGDKSLERRPLASSCRPFVERLEERSLLAGAGWREYVFSHFPALGILLEGEHGIAIAQRAADLAVLTGVPQTRAQPAPAPDGLGSTVTAGDGSTRGPRTSSSLAPGRASTELVTGRLLGPIGTGTYDFPSVPSLGPGRQVAPPPAERGEPPPTVPPKDDGTPPPPPETEPPPPPPVQDPSPEDTVPPDGERPTRPPPDPDLPPDPKRGAGKGPADKGLAPPALSPDAGSSRDALVPPGPTSSHRDWWPGVLDPDPFNTDLWSMRPADGTVSPLHHAAGLAAHDALVRDDSRHATYATGFSAHAWSVRLDGESAAAGPEQTAEPAGSGPASVDPFPAALLSRAWEKLPGGTETGLPATATDHARSSGEIRLPGAGRANAGTSLPAVYAATWLGEPESVPLVSLESADVAQAVTSFFAQAQSGAGADPAADNLALGLADTAAWEALAPGAGVARVQAGGPAGSTQSGAMVEENRTPWGLLFSPLLLAFATPRHYQATILLIEHDEPTRDAFHELLAHQGYLVLAAGTAHDAWGMLRAPLAPIDLVLLDAHLPDVSGMMLYARLRELYPDLPVVVCSAGELDPDELASFRDMGAPFYLRKPIAQEKLLATVQSVLR